MLRARRLNNRDGNTTTNHTPPFNTCENQQTETKTNTQRQCSYEMRAAPDVDKVAVAERQVEALALARRRALFCRHHIYIYIYRTNEHKRCSDSFAIMMLFYLDTCRVERLKMAIRFQDVELIVAR